MQRAVAIKKLSKYFGKSFGYRIDPKAPDQEEREEARAKLQVALRIRENFKRDMEARRAVLLADAEYQRLKAEHGQAQQFCDKLSSTLHHYKITVGTSNSMFFTVRAQGDTWEQIIIKLNEKVPS